MEHTLRANGAGTVARVHCAPGQQVDVHDLLVDGGAGMNASAGRRDILRIGNCSGFFGDRAHAAREMVEGGPLDVLTGDWLAELTMYILHKTRERSGGYARTFLRELEEVLPTCIERGITVVSNAGGPAAGGAGGRSGGVGPAAGPRRARGLGLGGRHHAGDGGAAGAGGEVRQSRYGRGASRPTHRS